ncbi:MAG: hypothetical protein Q8J88_17760 [Bacteroidales bacterium]|nr:hypothetical protein [Bacteroidales bacterium]
MKKPELNKATKVIAPQGAPLINPNSSLKVNISNVSKMNLKPMKGQMIQPKGKLAVFRKNLH